MRRVLVVEDEENLRLVLKTFLRRNGYEVEVAEDGEEALPMIDGFGPDFVITDVRMPRMGGMDLLAALAAKRSEATVIVMSAYGSHELGVRPGGDHRRLDRRAPRQGRRTRRPRARCRLLRRADPGLGRRLGAARGLDACDARALRRARHPLRR
jgi:CheY-like chemotaxis protein